MANKQFYSPLRYPGGKGKLISFIKSIYDSNRLKGNTYIEPYTGGGAVALSLLIDGYAENIIINDFDRSIYAFWYCLLNHTDELCQLINDTPITIDEWRRQKDIQENKNTAGILELGFSTFFLNRTNRSGIIKAGVIGGIHQSGDWKMNVRFNKVDLLNRIEKIAQFKTKIDLYNLDTCELLENINNNQNLYTDSFIYLDPPYYCKGKDLYVNFYKHQDHVFLSDKIKEIENIKWLLSYDNQKEIVQLYEEFKKITYNLTYSVEKKYQGNEVLIYSDNIKLPIKKANLKNLQRIKRRNLVLNL
ncbi:DNA adenine methylase [Tenacibaculum sp. 190130A14a]|uniref:DNA adenine methylase n=1 Tax=Tenacibaculum polynesiense TaxID=3137857 RepID=UPI003202B451